MTSRVSSGSSIPFELVSRPHATWTELEAGTQSSEKRNFQLADGAVIHIGTFVVTTVSANELADNGGRRITTADASNANRKPSRNKTVLTIDESPFSGVNP